MIKKLLISLFLFMTFGYSQSVTPANLPFYIGELYYIKMHIDSLLVADSSSIYIEGFSIIDTSLIGFLNQAEFIAGNWINTDNPWADNEVANDITVTNYTLLSAVGDTVIIIVDSTYIDGKNFLPDAQFDTHEASATIHHTAIVSGDIDHDLITGVSTSDHHTQTVDTNLDSTGVDVLGFIPDSEMTTHTGTSDVHHTQTVDTDTQDLSYNASTDVISLVDGGSIDITEVDTNLDSTGVDVLGFIPDSEMTTHSGTAGVHHVKFLTSDETDQVFVASQAYSVDSGDITNLGNLSGTNTGDEALSTTSAGLDVSDHAVNLDVTPSAGNATLEQAEDALQVKYDATLSEGASGLTVVTAPALSANGNNASAGNAILGVDAAGNAEGAFDVWTEAENTSAAYIADIVEDTTPQLGGSLDGQGEDLNNLGVIFMTEQAAAEVDVAGKLQLWTLTAIPNQFWWTDDVGNNREGVYSGGAFHDGFSDFVSGEHFLQSAISITESQISNLDHFVTGDESDPLALLTAGTDNVKDTHIAWGTGANQVSAVDAPIADAGAKITATEVEGALQENRTAIDLNTPKVTMTYPSAGIALSTGSAWSASITNNSANWNTAYTDRLKWDGGATGLTASTGRTSLGGTTIGQSIFTKTNPGAITFGRANVDNTFDWLNDANFRTAIGVDVAGTDNSTDVNLHASATTGGMSIAAQEISNRAATNAQTGYMTAALVTNIETNNAKVTDDDIGVAEVYNITNWNADIASPQKNDLRDYFVLFDTDGDGDLDNFDATNLASAIVELDPNVDTEAEIEAITGAFFGTSKAVTAGYIWVADGTDFESVVMSGEATIVSGGAITLDNDALDDQYYDSEADLTTLLDDNYEAELNNSAGLLAALSDETGNLLSVFSGSPTFTTDIEVNRDNILATQSDGYGLLLSNTTAATAANSIQYSPPTIWQGYGWKTDATAASQKVEFRSYVKPIEGTSAPTGVWVLESSINDGAYFNLLTVQSDGKVGIGIINPARKLVVEFASATDGTDGFKLNNTQSSTAYEFLIGGSTHGSIPSRFAIHDGSNYVFTLKDGNVGMGTINPISKLTVWGGSMDFYDATGAEGVKIAPTLGTAQQIHSDYRGGGSERDLVLGTFTNKANQLYLKTDGNVGINTNNPQGALDVRGTKSMFGSTQGSTYISNDEINFGYLTNGNYQGYINFSGYSGGATQFRDLGIYDGKNNLIAFFDGSSVNVGIGTITPLSKLSINGGLHVGGDSDAGDNNLLVDGTATANKFVSDTTSMPAFSVRQVAGGQAISDVTSTKLDWATEDWDTHADFNLTDEKFTPSIAGYYFITAGLMLKAGTMDAGDWFILSVKKNDTDITGGYNIQKFESTSEFYHATVNMLVYLNGTTDYVDAGVYGNLGVAFNTYDNNNYRYTYFQGYGIL